MIRTTTHIKRRMALIIGVILFVLFVVASGAVGTTFSTGSGTGALSLRIDNKTFYNGVLQPTLSWSLKKLVPGTDHFFKFDDVKPGDTGTTTMSIHLEKNPAWVCLIFTDLKDYENGRNEPELLVDTTPNKGELSDELEFFAWRDDGDNKFEVGEKPLFGTSTQKASVVLKNVSTYALADYLHGPAYLPNQTKYIGVTWCAGNLTVNTATAKIQCDATAMGNEAQTDSMTVEVKLRAVSSLEQPKFTCAGTPEIKHGNNGHGNDEDRNDDSNPGHSNDENDYTDDDGLPGNHQDENYTPWRIEKTSQTSLFPGRTHSPAPVVKDTKKKS